MSVDVLKAKDFSSDQDVKWCPGCGDYSILKQVQSVLPELGRKPEDIVFISGIGCSSRFPYYMNTYGMHSIHGRAPAIATGLKLANPKLDVWIITGDGDGLSIGGNHLIHLARRNPDVNVLLFNNEIYGLTKGQFSPTSQLGQRTKSSPLGVIDKPFNPASLLLGANATFVARAIDRDPKHLRNILLEAAGHKGSSFIEIYQNCHVFNDGVFEAFTDKNLKDEHAIYLEKDKPLIFDKGEKAIVLDKGKPVVIDSDLLSEDNAWIHDPSDAHKAFWLAKFEGMEDMPRPFGVLYSEDRPTYEDQSYEQMNHIEKEQKKEDLDSLLRGTQYWNISE